jgi:hypothetical protein
MAFMTMNDPLRNSQAKACARVSGRYKRVKNPLLIFHGNPWAIVTHYYVDFVLEIF